MARLLPVLLLAFMARPLGAQAREEHRWTVSRPDARGPASVSEDRTLLAGETQVTLTFSHLRREGEGDGADSLSAGQVLSSYEVSQARLLTQGLRVDLLVGVTGNFTVGASTALTRKLLDNVTRAEGEPERLFPFQMEASGLQDVQIHALYRLHEGGPVRVHLQGGLSVPVGAIDGEAVTPITGSAPAQLPYDLQLGSGTFDLLPGFTLNVQNPKASLGVQVKGVLRLGENDRGWKLGNVLQGHVWAGYYRSRWASAYLGASVSRWGTVRGSDPGLDPRVSPAHDPRTQGGWKVEIPLGFNFVVPPGRFGGHRLSMEFLTPVHQELDGPQLRHRWSLVLAWQRSLAF